MHRVGHFIPKCLTKFSRQIFPNMSFITVHYLFFITVPLVLSVVFWGISTPVQSVTYTDSLFLCISAVTEAGLNPVNLSTINTAQQVIIFILTVVGSPLITSAAVLVIRKNAFEKRFGDIVVQSEGGNHTSTSDGGDRNERTSSIRSNHSGSTASSSSYIVNKDSLGKTGPQGHPESESSHRRTQNPTVTSGTSATSSLKKRNSNCGGQASSATIEAQDDSLGRRHSKLDKYIDTVEGFIGRNSSFGGLSNEEKCVLGGVEYRAVQLLCWLVPTYIVVWQFFGVLAMGLWCHFHLHDVSTQNGLNAFWNGAFFAVSAFNNSGIALLDINAVAFQRSYFPLLTLSLLILAGNTCYPPFLRLTLWISKYCIPRNTTSRVWIERRKTIEFILDHPRRVYTHLFPSLATWWVVLTLFVLNGIDWVAFELMNIGNPEIESIPPRYRVLDGLFQAFAIRIGGFAVVDIASLRPALLVLYVVMMYISVFPVTMAIRSTNVYEEQSLGIFPEDPRNPHHLEMSSQTQGSHGAPANKYSELAAAARSLLRTFTMSTTPPSYGITHYEPRSFLHHQLTIQLSHDLWWIAVAVILIQLVETSQSLSDPVVFSTFNMVFEIVSGYGTVGVSTGVPWDNFSFCGSWHTTSKLVLCAVMLRGRHRGLPVEVDKAIMLPRDVVEDDQAA